MHERIYTIPVNTAFEQHDDCPFCLLYKQLEATEIDLITGASMMEPDVRVRTNKLGFCRHHFDMMYENQKRLSLALTIQSHLEELKKEISAGGFLRRKAREAYRRAERKLLCLRTNRRKFRKNVRNSVSVI